MKNSSNGSNEQQSQNVHSENNNFVFPSNKSALNNHNKYDYDRDDFDIDEDQDENFNNRRRRPSSSNLDLKDTDLSKLQNSLLLQKTVSINNDFFNKKQIQEKQNVFDIQNSSNQQKRDIIQKNSEQQNKEAKKPKLRKKLKLRKVVKGQRDHRSKYNNNYPSQRANKYESQNRYQKKIPKNQKNQFQTWDDEDQTDKIYPLKNKREEENWPKQEYQKKREYNEDYQSVHKDSYRKKNRKNQYQKVKMKGFFELTEEFRRELKEQDKVKMIEQDIYSYLYSELWNKFSYILDYIKKFSQEREKGRRIMKQRLDIIVKKTLQNKFYVQEYGSAATQLLTPFSDLDLQIKIRQRNSKISIINYT